MLVAPTEHRLASLGESSALPEQMGSDFLLFTRHGLVGVQRKEVKDLVASVHDGRFQREMAQLVSSDLHQAVLLIEGDFQFGTNGESLALRHTRWTRASFHGIELSTQQLGIWVVRTDGLDDTASWLTQAESWFDRADHVSLAVRPKAPRGVWENPDYHFWSAVLQCFPGISAVTARAIWERARDDGVDLLAWQVDETWFKTVPGVGPKRAAVLAGAFNGKVTR